MNDNVVNNKQISGDATLNDLYANINKHMDEISNLQKEIDDAKKEIIEVEVKKSEVEKDIRVIENNLEKLSEQRERLLEESRQLRKNWNWTGDLSKCHTVDDEINETKKVIEKAQQEREKLEKEITEKRKKLDVYFKTLDNKKMYEAEKSGLGMNRNSRIKEQEEVKNKYMLERNSIVKKFDLKKSELKHEFELQKSELSKKLNDEKGKLDKGKKELKNKIRDCDVEINKSNESIGQCENQIEALKSELLRVIWQRREDVEQADKNNKEKVDHTMPMGLLNRIKKLDFLSEAGQNSINKLSEDVQKTLKNKNKEDAYLTLGFIKEKKLEIEEKITALYTRLNAYYNDRNKQNTNKSQKKQQERKIFKIGEAGAFEASLASTIKNLERKLQKREEFKDTFTEFEKNNQKEAEAIKKIIISIIDDWNKVCDKVAELPDPKYRYYDFENNRVNWETVNETVNNDKCVEIEEVKNGTRPFWKLVDKLDNFCSSINSLKYDEIRTMGLSKEFKLEGSRMDAFSSNSDIDKYLFNIESELIKIYGRNSESKNEKNKDKKDKKDQTGLTRAQVLKSLAELIDKEIKVLTSRQTDISNQMEPYIKKHRDLGSQFFEYEKECDKKSKDLDNVYNEKLKELEDVYNQRLKELENDCNDELNSFDNNYEQSNEQSTVEITELDKKIAEREEMIKGCYTVLNNQKYKKLDEQLAKDKESVDDLDKKISGLTEEVNKVEKIEQKLKNMHCDYDINCSDKNRKKSELKSLGSTKLRKLKLKKEKQLALNQKIEQVNNFLSEMEEIIKRKKEELNDKKTNQENFKKQQEPCWAWYLLLIIGGIIAKAVYKSKLSKLDRDIENLEEQIGKIGEQKTNYLNSLNGNETEKEIKEIGVK